MENTVIWIKYNLENIESHIPQKYMHIYEEWKVRGRSYELKFINDSGISEREILTSQLKSLNLALDEIENANKNAELIFKIENIMSEK